MVSKINEANKATQYAIEQAEQAGVLVNVVDHKGVTLGLKRVPRYYWGAFLALAKERIQSEQVLVKQTNHKVTVGVCGLGITISCSSITDALYLYRAVNEYVS